MPQKNNNIESIQSRDGKTYWIETGDTMYGKRLRHGQYQSRNWRFAQTLLQNTRRCVDIGSNSGLNAIHYAEVFDWVECFEPTHLCQQLWRNTIRDNGVANVTLHTEALGEDDRTTDIIIHDCNSGHNHLAHYDKNPRARGTARTKQTVQQTTLDSFHFTDVDFVKIDVEGYELFVLQGGEQTVQHNRPILQLEILDRQCRKFNYSRTDIADWMKKMNYRCCTKLGTWVDLYNHKDKRNEMDLFFVPFEAQTLPPQLKLFG